MADAAQRWMAQSQYDLETKAMFDTGRYLYVLFCCQQAVEKMLKALIVKWTRTLPPRLHNLMRLAEVASLTVPEDTACFFRRLTGFYIATRYPEELDRATQAIDRSQVWRTYTLTEDALQWLASVL
jgi:HEPN domain-containing protein